MFKRIVSVKIFIILIICFIFCYKMYNKNNLIKNYIQGINYNDLDEYVIENGKVTIYIFSSDKKYNYDFQKKFSDIIVKNNLQNKLIYLDIENYIENDGYDICNITFNNIPMLITFDNTKIKDSYDIKKHNYNVEDIEKYLERVGVINYD